MDISFIPMFGVIPLLGLLGAAGIMAGGSIGAAILGGGSKPKIPEFKPVDIAGAAKKATQTSLAQFDESAKLASKTNQFNVGETQKMWDYFAPQAKEIQGLQTDLIKSELSGVLGDQEMQYLRDYSAASGLSKGFGALGTSAAAQNNFARNLGLSSLQLKQSGFGHAQQWMALAQSRMPQQFDISRSFLSPQQVLAAEVSNNTGQYQRDLMAAGVAAAPDPGAAAIGAGLGGFGNMLGSAVAINAMNPQAFGAGGLFGSNQTFVQKLGANAGPGTPLTPSVVPPKV